jgi:HSP20 family protein
MVFRYRNPRYPLYQFRDEIDRLLGGFLGQAADGDQIEISVVGNELSLKVQRPDLAQDGVAYHRRERPTGNFTRVLRLPVEVNADKVQAELAHGVLTLTLPKAESAKPRKIKVATAS